MPITVRASIWFIFCNVLLKGIGFLTTPIFAKLLPIDEYGKLSIFASYEQIIVIFATWEIGLSPFQRGLFKYKTSTKLFSTVVIAFSMTLSVVIGIIAVVFSNQIINFTEMPLWLLGVLFLYVFSYTPYVCWMTEKKLEYDYKKFSIVTVGLTFVKIICALVAVIFINATAEIKLAFSLIPAIIVNSVLLIKRYRPILLLKEKDVVKEQIRFLVGFSFPLVIHSLSYLILGQADRVMIGKMVNNSAAGLYSVAYTIASVVIIVQSGVLQVITPWIYRQIEQKAYKEIGKNISKILMIVSALYIAFILVAPDLVIVLFPEQYWESICCLPPISIGVYFMFMYSLFVTIEECMDETKYIALVSIVCALTNIVLNYVGIILFGYVACAYTTLFCYIMFALGHYYFMKKILRQKAENAKIFNGRVFGLVGVMMVILMLGITFVYECRFLRYSVFVILIILGVMLRNRFLPLLRNFIAKK